MLPDFTKVKQLTATRLHEFYKERIRFYNPGFADAPERLIHEGTGTTTVNAESNFEHDMELQHFQAASTISIDDLIRDPSNVYKVIDELAKQMAEQQAKMIFETVSEVTEKAGNVTKRKGKVTPEAIFDMYEKIQISFDNHGFPHLPAIHAGEQMIAEIKEAFDEINTNPQLTQRFDQIISNKKQEWNDRENNRKLVG